MTYEPNSNRTDPDRVDPDVRVADRSTGRPGAISLILGALIAFIGLFAIYSYSTTSTNPDTAVTGSTRPADAPAVPRTAPAAPRPAPATPSPAPAAPAN